MSSRMLIAGLALLSSSMRTHRNVTPHGPHVSMLAFQHVTFENDAGSLPLDRLEHIAREIEPALRRCHEATMRAERVAIYGALELRLEVNDHGGIDSVRFSAFQGHPSMLHCMRSALEGAAWPRAPRGTHERVAVIYAVLLGAEPL